MFWDFLSNFGFSAYEQQVLQGLLRYGICSPSLLCEKQGIPSSKVYSAVKRLVERGLVVDMPDNTYALISVAELIVKLKGIVESKNSEYLEGLLNLQNYVLHQVAEPSPTQVRWWSDHVPAFESLLARTKTQDSISICWNIFSHAEANSLAELVAALKEKNVVTQQVLFSPTVSMQSAPQVRQSQAILDRSYIVNMAAQQVIVRLETPNGGGSLYLSIDDAKTASEHQEMFWSQWYKARV